MSFNLVKHAAENQIGMIVSGYNEGWKHYQPLRWTISEAGRPAVPFSLPFNCGWWLGRHIINDPIDAVHFPDDFIRHTH
jgi:hypothetical protein